MLCIGHFSFDEIGAKAESRHGYFTCIVDAGDAQAALQKFKACIEKLKKKGDLFEGVAAVYLEDIIEARKVPHEALITRFQSSAGAFPRSVSCCLPHGNTDGLAAFGWSGGERSETDGEEYAEAQAFLRFDEAEDVSSG